MELNIYQVLILLGVLHGLIFSGVLLFHPKYASKTNRFLSLTVLCLVSSNIQYLLILLNLLQIQNIFIIPIEILIIPFFYLFVHKYLNLKISTIEKRVLFIPFFIALLLIILDYYSFNNFDFYKVYENSSSLYSLFLIVVIYFKIRKYETLKEDRNTIKLQVNWLKHLLIIGIIICLYWFYSINSFTVGKISFYPFYILWISISFLIYWIGYVSVFKAQITNERKQIRRQINKLSTNNKNREVSQELYTRIIYYIKNEKAYLSSELDLKHLANKFDKSPSYISQLINKNQELNLTDFISQLRVEKSKEMLLNPDFDKYTITAIALESGFKSKSSFYSAFKKFTQKTPKEFKSVRDL
ncbi:helix-turn-helix domain-containing protein [Pseudofulvibacter geojedonensis]|uniref:Helix-turn-helix domain-containing protein n=1 Tax=Pseudofulvibacter geojedonensis TaxID=1123758 RepID=A0ABW3I3T2_9FLAO